MGLTDKKDKKRGGNTNKAFFCISFDKWNGLQLATHTNTVDPLPPGLLELRRILLDRPKKYIKEGDLPKPPE